MNHVLNLYLDLIGQESTQFTHATAVCRSSVTFTITRPCSAGISMSKLVYAYSFHARLQEHTQIMNSEDGKRCCRVMGTGGLIEALGYGVCIFAG